jgi:hypothetical protein
VKAGMSLSFAIFISSPFVRLKYEVTIDDHAHRVKGATGPRGKGPAAVSRGEGRGAEAKHLRKLSVFAEATGKERRCE